MDQPDDASTRIFYIHVMKTGGNSVIRLLREQFPPDSWYPASADGGERPVAAKLFVDLLLELDSAERERILCYSVHMPAWVAAEVAPQHVTMTVLREPVERTISHLNHLARMATTPDDLEEIYDDPEVSQRLGNYQTRLFSESKEDYERGRRMTASFTPTQVTATRAKMEEAMQRFWTTGIRRGGPIGQAELDQALDRLASMDEVGTTDQLDGLRGRLERRLGRSLPPVEHRNAAPSYAHITARLHERIQEDTALDAVLYERARELARA